VTQDNESSLTCMIHLISCHSSANLHLHSAAHLHVQYLNQMAPAQGAAQSSARNCLARHLPHGPVMHMHYTEEATQVSSSSIMWHAVQAQHCVLIGAAVQKDVTRRMHHHGQARQGAADLRWQDVNCLTPGVLRCSAWSGGCSAVSALHRGRARRARLLAILDVNDNVCILGVRGTASRLSRGAVAL